MISSELLQAKFKGVLSGGLREIKRTSETTWSKGRICASKMDIC